MTRFGPKMGQIGPKWVKSGTFSDQISLHFGAAPNDVYDCIHVSKYFERIYNTVNSYQIVYSFRSDLDVGCF